MFPGQKVAMQQRLTKAERVNGDFHGPAAHAGVHFAAEHGGGRTGNEETDFFGVEDPPGEGFPAGYQLDFIEKKRDTGRIPELRMQLEIAFQKERQVGGVEAGQAVVLEIEINERRQGTARGNRICRCAAFRSPPWPCREPAAVGFRDASIPGLERRASRSACL